MEIFNRWGEKIYETTNFEDGWDGTFKGKALNAGTFTYKLEYRLINGLSGSLNGNVTLYK